MASRASDVQGDGEQNCSAEIVSEIPREDQDLLPLLHAAPRQPGLDNFSEASLARIPEKSRQKQDLPLISLLPLGLSLPQDPATARAAHSCPESWGMKSGP